MDNGTNTAPTAKETTMSQTDSLTDTCTECTSAVEDLGYHRRCDRCLITDAQIESIRDGAGQAGDFALVATCERALGDDLAETEIPADVEALTRVRALSVYDARREVSAHL